jgi:hypothetical protein
MITTTTVARVTLLLVLLLALPGCAGVLERVVEGELLGGGGDEGGGPPIDWSGYGDYLAGQAAGGRTVDLHACRAAYIAQQRAVWTRLRYRATPVGARGGGAGGGGVRTYRPGQPVPVVAPRPVARPAPARTVYRGGGGGRAAARGRR